MSLVELTEGMSTANISDAMDHLGYPCKWLSESLQATHRTKFWGFADTVMWGPARKSGEILKPSASTWEEVGPFVDKLQSGSTNTVYVAGAREISTRYVLAGGMSLTYIARCGYDGAVIHGAIRDYDEVIALNMPIWYSNYALMDSQGCMVVEARGQGCTVNSHFVTQGDFIYGDGNGVIAIPAVLVEAVLTKAQHIKAVEDSVLERVKSGENLFTLVSQGGHI